MKCSKCGQEIPVEYCPLLKTDCMKRDNLPCGEYPSPQCSNEEAICNFDGTSERQCGTCGYVYRAQGGIKGIKVMMCEILGKMIIPVQSCYKPEKWWKKKTNPVRAGK